MDSDIFESRIIITIIVVGLVVVNNDKAQRSELGAVGDQRKRGIVWLLGTYNLLETGYLFFKI